MLRCVCVCVCESVCVCLCLCLGWFYKSDTTKYRDGEQTGETVYASVNKIPSDARRSIFGECAHELPGFGFQLSNNSRSVSNSSFKVSISYRNSLVWKFSVDQFR